MAKNLVLVESPSKAKTINKYLGKGFTVEATVGHIRNLPKTKLGVEIENGFKPNLTNIRGKGDVIKRIKTVASSTQNIYIATDPDREGEAIAQDIVDVIKDKTDAKIYRVLFNEITKNSVTESMKHPREIDEKMVESQRARRVMDRIIGYKLSPFLWQAVIDANASSLSAGRVQTIALRLICEREEEIEKFIQTEYWSVWCEFTNEQGDSIKAKLFEIDGRSVKLQPKPVMNEKDWTNFNKNNFALNNKETVDDIISRIKQLSKIGISDISTKDTLRNPFPPFITSSLQAEASKSLKFRPRNTMKVAQSLYEGVDLGPEGLVGLITYMRTDSYRLSDEITGEALKFINDKFGKEYAPQKARQYSVRGKTKVQDAHEAIRPTSLKYTPEYVEKYLTPEQFKLYVLVWKRFLASQMNSAIIENKSISIEGGNLLFRATGSVVKFDGFLKVYDEEAEEKNESDDNGIDRIIPAGIKNGQSVTINDIEEKQHFTKPPARFTESTLIKELESNGIGRPSTYALIIGTIQDREYIFQEERKLHPTGLGKKVNSVLIHNFSELFDVTYTATMESKLDMIASGEAEYFDVMHNFYDPFEKNLTEVESKIERVKCDKCGSDMEVKVGRFGKFLACTNYPECKNIKPIKEPKKEKEEPEYTGEKCEKCGGRTIFRSGKFGKFIGCENYPECDYTKQLTLDIKCPKCKTGDVVPRRSKRGKMFYGCSRYPDCDYISWTKPSETQEENN